MWELPAGTDGGELTPVLVFLCSGWSSMSQFVKNGGRRSPREAKSMIWIFTWWWTKQNDKLLPSPIILLVALRVFLYLTAFFELVDDFSQSCFQAPEISGGMEKGSCLEGELFAGVLSRVHNSGFISPTPLPVAQPDVLSSLCCKMLSN